MKLHVDKSVSGEALNKFFSDSREIGTQIHTFSVYEDGKQLVEFVPQPYDDKYKSEVFSLSKTFTSTIFAIACDRGLVRVDDKIIDIFPDKCPERISENLSKMTVENVLSMNTGHERCVMSFMSESNDTVKAFLSQPVLYTPGTHFVYNTGATCLLGKIIEKVANQNFFGFAYENFFLPMEMEDVYWETCKDGSTECGIGLHVSNEDIAKLGMLYTNGGIWKGKRIVSEEWINKATSFISDNSPNENINSGCGYGYQIWLNSFGGFRGAGSYGQYCVVIPEKKLVVSITSNSENMAKLLELLGKFTNEFHGKDSNLFAGYDYEPTQGGSCDICGTYKFENNICGFSYVDISQNNDVIKITYCDDCSCESFEAGSGKWMESVYNAKNKMQKILDLSDNEKKEKIHMASCYEVEKDTLVIHSRLLNSPLYETAIFRVYMDDLTIEYKGRFDTSNVKVPILRARKI